MKKSLEKIKQGYFAFRKKYATGQNSSMRHLAHHGQNPDIMVVACCDARVDPALILQCDPGDLFIVRNVANIVPPYEADQSHHGTSAALEFGICYLNVKHLIILGHSQCGGIHALLDNTKLHQDDFITHWVSFIKTDAVKIHDADTLAKHALCHSYENCLTFPWIKQRILEENLQLHLWFFDIQEGEILTYSLQDHQFHSL